MNTIWFVAFLISAHCLPLIICAPGNGMYTDACSSEKPCDSTRGLVCSNNVWHCVGGNTIDFSDDWSRSIYRKECRVKAYHSCFYTEKESAALGLPYPSPTQKPCVDIAACVNGICKCNSECYYSAGFCSDLNFYLQDWQTIPCSSNLNCNSSKQLECQNGKCLCRKPHILVAQNPTNECQIIAGQECELGDFCVSNAQCVEQHWMDDGSRVSRCVCNPEHLQTVDGYCELVTGYNATCSEDKPCKTTDGELRLGNFASKYPSYFACQNGRCLCNDTLAVAEMKIGKGFVCRLKVGV